MKRKINNPKIRVSERWVKMNKFEDFQKLSSIANLSYKDQLKIWTDAGGKNVNGTKKGAK